MYLILKLRLRFTGTETKNLFVISVRRQLCVLQQHRGPPFGNWPKYNPDEWRLFIDSSKGSVKCVLLRNGSKLTCVPIGHSVILKEHYTSVRMVLQKLCQVEHKWIICVDLKMVNFLLGQQDGYTNNPSFLCLWDSKANDQHWEKKVWPIREELVVGKKMVINEPVVNRDRIILPPLHIKLGLMKQMVHDSVTSQNLQV